MQVLMLLLLWLAHIHQVPCSSAALCEDKVRLPILIL